MSRWLQRVVAACRNHPDRGSLELFYAGVALIGFLVVGLVVDLGAALNATSDADYRAQEAARAGAQQLDAGQAITGEALVVDPAAAQSGARAYLEGRHLDGDVTVSADRQQLHVTVHTTYQPIFASLLGYTQLPVTGHGSAVLLHQAKG
ncbi:pilus assembly protein TadG-related protein [Streptomyces sp. NPDC001205]